MSNAYDIAYAGPLSKSRYYILVCDYTENLIAGIDLVLSP